MFVFSNLRRYLWVLRSLQKGASVTREGASVFWPALGWLAYPPAFVPGADTSTFLAWEIKNNAGDHRDRSSTRRDCELRCVALRLKFGGRRGRGVCESRRRPLSLRVASRVCVCVCVVSRGWESSRRLFHRRFGFPPPIGAPPPRRRATAFRTTVRPGWLWFSSSRPGFCFPRGIRSRRWAPTYCPTDCPRTSAALHFVLHFL